MMTGKKLRAFKVPSVHENHSYLSIQAKESEKVLAIFIILKITFV